MNLLRFLQSIAVFFLIAASCEKTALLAQKIPGYGPNAKACALLPISDLETLYRGKADTPHGFDDESGGSICSVSIAGALAKVQTAAPGDPGAPHSVQEAFALIPMISQDNKGKTKFETKDYGKVGCVKLELAAAALGDLAKGQKSANAVSCFLVEKSYLNLTLGSTDAQQMNFDTVKQLLEKTAARRKN
jgi:hypothetical protein